MLPRKFSGSRKLWGFSILEVLFVLFVTVAIVALSVPKFIHMKTVARKQALDSIAHSLENASRFIRAQAFLTDAMSNPDEYTIVCFNRFNNEKCGKKGTSSDIVSTYMVLVRKGFPFVSMHTVTPIVSLLGYHYTSFTHEELKKKINREIRLFETCGSYCRISDLTKVCDTDFCVQDSTEGALVLLQETSASDKCYVRYKHDRGDTPEIEIVSSGC